MSFNYKEIEAAYERISGVLPVTPLAESFELSTEGQKYFF